MLAGTIYFYDEYEVLVKQLDLEEYEDLSNAAFMRLVGELDAEKVILRTFSHNHHSGKVIVLYSKNKKQT